MDPPTTTRATEVSGVSSGIENSAVTPTERGSRDHRRHTRFPFTALVEALEPKTNTQISGRSSDVSISGCYVDTLSPFPIGTVIRIRLTRENVSFEANAKVVFSQIGMGMGVSYISAEKDMFLIYQKWIRELSGDTPEEPDALEEGQLRGRGADSQEEQRQVLFELVSALTRKGVLTEAEGKTMLKRIHR